MKTIIQLDGSYWIINNTDTGLEAISIKDAKRYLVKDMNIDWQTEIQKKLERKDDLGNQNR